MRTLLFLCSTAGMSPGKTILLVEDNADDVLFLTLALQKAGAGGSLQTVTDGQQAVDYLAGKRQYADRTVHPLPALVLLDLKLPRVPGLEVLRWLRSQPELQHIAVVMLTSSDYAADIQQAYALGANSFLTKPSNPTELPELIESVVDYWLKRNVPATA